MGKTGTRLPGFCLNRIRPHARVRSPPIHHKPAHSISDRGNQDVPVKDSVDAAEKKLSEAVKATARKVMIVVDSSTEAKGALQWALSHTIQSHDTIFLLHVIKPTQQPANSDECNKETAPRAYQLVQSLKHMCQLKLPEVKIETLVVQGKDKGPVIVEQANKQEAGLLVLGQKRKSMTWRLLMMWAGGGRTPVLGTGSACGGVAKYCIQNATCMAIAVRRKNKKLGGYLITTKRQKDFWLLA